jgi:hypothetical protein
MTNPGPENDLVNERLRDVDESFLVVIPKSRAQTEEESRN